MPIFQEHGLSGGNLIVARVSKRVVIRIVNQKTKVLCTANGSIMVKKEIIKLK